MSDSKSGGKWAGHVSSEVKSRYNRKVYQTVSFRVHRDGSDGIMPDQIRAAAEREGLSVNQWIINILKDFI